MMRRWLPVVGLGILVRAILILVSFVWVAFYSHVLNPGQAYAQYQAWAAHVSPWIGIAGGIPLVYLFCRKLARTRPAIPTALVMFATCAALDLLMVMLTSGADAGACALGLLTTLASGLLGARAGRSRVVATAA